MKAETAEQARVLDDGMYKLTSQWTVDPTKLAGKRDELMRLLKEVGRARFQSAIRTVLDEYSGEFCPTIGIIRQYVPSEQQRTRHRCSSCIDGWVYCEEKDSMGNPTVTRCPNFHDVQYRAARSGQVVQEVGEW